MKYRKSLLLILAAGAGACEAASAQVAPPPPAPPSVAQPPEVQITGRVTRLLINPNGDVDGLLLDQGSQVGTAPRLSGAITQSVRAGDTVIVQGTGGRGAPIIHARVVVDQRSDRTITDQPPAAPPPPPTSTLSSLAAQGRVERLLYTGAGDLNGALLADGSIVRWPPHLSGKLRETIGVGSTLSAFGFGTRNTYGRSLEASSLSIDDGPPLSIFPPGPP